MEEDDVEVVRVHDKDAYLVEPTRRVFQELKVDQFDYKHIKIPRKPAWNRDMTAEEVDRNEKNAFLEWRRDIAALEEANESAKATPYEKNIDVWRQLWRVLEKCDMAVQIVDARNPLLYYTRDLINYGCEIDPSKPKLVMLLVNKADFLTEYQRRYWARYFSQQGIPFAFYSARIEQDKLDNNVSDLDDEHYDSEGDDEDEEEEEEEEALKKVLGTEESLESLAEDITSTWKEKILAELLKAKEEEKAEGKEGKVGTTAAAPRPTVVKSSYLDAEKERQRSRILTRGELMDLIDCISENMQLEAQERHGERICVGLLGYPNVGKSSVINTLLGVSKSTHGVTRVAISSTPGKTKHFQTIMLNDSIMLCDCPGLVFPSFMNSTGEMLCSGILPINQMRNCADPADVIASRVPMYLLDAAYGMKITRILDVKDDPNRPPTGTEMLAAYCKVKGYIAGQSGRWDEFRGCKDMLRDFNDGKILYVCAPPGMNVPMDRWLADIENVMARKERVAERLAVQRLKDLEEQLKNASVEDDIDDVPKAASSGAELLEGYEEGTMVFGDASYRASKKAAAAAKAGKSEEQKTTADGFVYYDDDSDDEQLGQLNAAFVDGKGGESSTKREHKRLKHWGKKNKKLRDKDPYGEANGVVSYVAYTTNRCKVGGETWERVKKQGSTKSYGSHFVRAMMPHSNVNDVPTEEA